MIDAQAYLDDNGRKKAVNTLNQLIARRSKLMNQTAKSAVVATLIAALKSVRAASKDARRTKKFKPKVEFTGWYGGFTWPEKKPCVRVGPSPRDPKAQLNGMRVAWLARNVKKQKLRLAFKVTPESTAKAPYIVVCASAKEAMAYEASASKHRVERLGGLARNAIGVAMNKVSTAKTQLEGRSASLVDVNSLAKAVVVDSGNSITAIAVDQLEYSSQALKGGEAALGVALKKAANKVWATVQRLAGLQLGAKTAAPFPEVKLR